MEGERMPKAKSYPGRIRIITTPAGEAPEWVREAWKLVPELPCNPYLGHSGLFDKGALSQKELSTKRNGVSVPQKEALELLRQVAPQAAKWWHDHGFPCGEYFGFGEDEVRILSGVEHQKIVLVDDDMQGDPYR